MKPILNVVQLSSVSIYQQLKWEEALLRTDKSNWCLINRGSMPAIVMGLSGKMEQWIKQDRLAEFSIPVIRRCSGGGTVVVDKSTIFITLICQNEALSIPPFPIPLMRWIADNMYQPLFPSSFQLQDCDYSLAGRKWGGNAQSIIKGRWLHHSSILWDYNEEYMNLLTTPPKMPAYRQGRSHKDFLCKLRDHWSDSISLEEKVIERLSCFFSIKEKEKEELNHFEQLPHRKATIFLHGSIS